MRTLLACLLLLTLTACEPTPAPPPPAIALPDSAAVPAPEIEALRLGLDRLQERAALLRGRLERVERPRPDEEAALRRIRYQTHLDRARALGVRPVGTLDEVRGYVSSGTLVPLVDNEFYVVRDMESSVPAVTPATRAMLRETGRRFQARLAELGLPPYRFMITSATRTLDSQSALSRSNRNAARGNSSHQYGTCVDIVYTKYPAPTSVPDPLGPTGVGAVDQVLEDYVAYEVEAGGARYWEHLAGVMGRVMVEMQAERRWVVLLESRQPVFHVTLWNA